MAGRILITDGVATNRIVLKVKLGEACYDTLMAADGAACLHLARTAGPDLILLNRALPDLDGLEVVRLLRANPATQDIPVVMICNDAGGAPVLAALQAGADAVLVKPFDDTVMLARLRGLLRARAVADDLLARGAGLGALGLAEAAGGFDGPGRIALIAARPETALRWRKDLAAHLPGRLPVLSREEALADGALPADVYLIEADLDRPGSGLRLMSDLRSRSGSRHAAVCIVLPDAGAEGAAMALDLGAGDLVHAGADPREMALQLRSLLRRKRRADTLRATVQDGLRLAVIDPLTGLYNRRYALAQVATIIAAARLGGTPFAVMVIDLDRFKQVNDGHGHAAGDAVLAEVARRLQANLRDGDLIARIGGEEFLVALPDTGLARARLAAERLCTAVQECPFALPGGGSLNITVSIGLAVGAGGPGAAGDPVAGIVDRADRALLSAKAEGRNQVTISRSAA